MNMPADESADMQAYEAEALPGWAARALTGLYPPAWRARYGTEFAALLADTGIAVRQVADVVLAAARAWLCPAPHLHDRAARMRATIAVTLAAWTALATGAVLFAKLSHDGALYLTDPAHGATARWYDGYVLSAGLSTAAFLLGALPLAVVTLRHAAGASRWRVCGLLAVPGVAILGFLGAAAAVGHLMPPAGPRDLSGGFVALAVLGVLAAGMCAAGPALAVHGARPGGRTLMIAVVAGGCAVGLMTLAAGAGVASELTRDQHHAEALTAYSMLAAVVCAVAATSCSRVLRSAVGP